MSPAAELLKQARARGVTLRARGERLVVDGPEAAVHELRPALRAAKTELLALLRALSRSAPAGDTVRSPAAPYRCHACWRYFPEAQLTVVQETLGRGFRCRNCLRSHRSRLGASD
jgi:DNA-directed RNA polymerase subunit RPC12/RpoP